MTPWRSAPGLAHPAVHADRIASAALVLAVILTGCSVTASDGTSRPSGGASASAAASRSATRTSQASPNAQARFPAEAFADLGGDPVSDELAAELQAVLETSANGVGLTAAVISPQGIWNGAAGLAVGTRPMVPDDQMAIASITKTIVAAQVMQLVERGELRLNDLAADRLPPDLEFDANGSRIIDLLSMRSGIPQFFSDEERLKHVLTADPMHVWTLEEKLATVASERGPIGQDWEYAGTNYLLLGSIIEQATGRSVAEVLRGGVIAGDEYDRLIYQPDERPTDPMAFALESGIGVTADTFASGGGYLPSLAVATMFATDGGMAADSLSVALWFRELCAGRVVSSASVDEMTDFVERPGYGLGVIDRSDAYWPGSGALGHQGGNIGVALCFQSPISVVVVLANAEHDVDTIAGSLVRAASR